ncbi:hypothetical protein [Rhodobacter sp. SY28-1]|uniref:hypothetical protein n=1 Tax=Rhodobacter sp. SY28-1 TaxID=2562317 RepID=UPI0014855403|nr:hypothetical protein [Rhodobacter sp. SY28-1]
MAKDIEEFDFSSTSTNEGLVKDLATRSFVSIARAINDAAGTSVLDPEKGAVLQAD